MRNVAMAWVGPTMTGHGSAVCFACGWTTSDKMYGSVAIAAIWHDAAHESALDGAA